MSRSSILARIRKLDRLRRKAGTREEGLAAERILEGIRKKYRVTDEELREACRDEALEDSSQDGSLTVARATGGRALETWRSRLAIAIAAHGGARGRVQHSPITGEVYAVTCANDLHGRRTKRAYEIVLKSLEQTLTAERSKPTK